MLWVSVDKTARNRNFSTNTAQLNVKDSCQIFFLLVVGFTCKNQFENSNLKTQETKCYV